MTYVYALVIVCLLLLIWLGYGVKRIVAVSRGEMIGNRKNSALLLVDLQTVFWESGTYPETARKSAEAAIRTEADAARVQGDPVIALRQEWSIPSTKAIARLTMKGQALEGSAGTELAPAFASLPDHVMVKRVQDAFETGELDTLLKSLDVGKLRIVGLDFNYCVQKTALAARNRGYEVTVVKAGTLAAGDRADAEKLMESHGVIML